MNYKVLHHAKVVIATDGSNQLGIDVGNGVIPLNNRLCYEDKHTITFDGNIEGKEYHEGLNMVKISDDYVPLPDVTSITYISPEGVQVFPAADLQIIDMNGTTVIGGYIPGDAHTKLFAISCKEDSPETGLSAGTYVHCEVHDYGEPYASTDVYVAQVEYANIKKIDDKYLPVGIPIVVTSELILPDIEIPEKAASELIPLIRKGVPVILFTYTSPHEGTVGGVQCTDMFLRNYMNNDYVYVSCLSSSVSRTAFLMLTNEGKIVYKDI